MSGQRFSILLASLAVALATAAPAVAGPRLPPARPIAVEWRRDVWQPPDVRTMDLQGQNRLTVATDLRRGGRARWSPDGLRLGGYHKPVGSGQWDVAIMSVRADGTDERTVLTAADFDAYNVARGHKPGREKGFGRPFSLAAYGPAASSIVFGGVIRYEGPASDPLDDRYQQRLFIVDLVTGAITAVTDGDGEHDDFDPYWSWNRGQIVFVRSATSRCSQCEGIPERVGQQQLWTVNPDGTGLRQLTAFTPATLPSGHGRELAAPVWSPDGNRVAVVGAFTSSSLYSGDLWLLNVDAGPVMTSATALRAAGGTAEWHPAFSPTGHKIVFARLTPANSREERSQIVIVDLATNSDRVIVEQTKQVVFQPDWNPVEPVPTP